MHVPRVPFLSRTCLSIPPETQFMVFAMKKKILVSALLIFAVLVLILGYVTHVSISQCRTELEIVSHTLETDFTHPIRIVQLTDLHSHSFGSDNEKLIRLILQQDPDLIVMTGDMMDDSDESPDVVCHLIRELSGHVPVWYGYGNHEREWMNTTGTDLTSILEEAGATVLTNEYRDITVNGQEIRIGGHHAYYRYTGMYKISPEQSKEETDFANSFEATDRFKLLLCHIPTVWLDWKNIDMFPVDLVLTGHYHGGQIRLPLLGPLYAPYIGFFPEYTEGLFIGQEAACVLSRGLGSSPGIPRINNLPEITVIDLIPKQ